VRVLIIIWLVTHSVLHAQDYRFNSFQTATAGINPALLGVIDGDWRVTVQYRSVFSSILGSEGFKGLSAAGEYRLPTSKGDFWGFAMQALQHQAGASRYETEGILGSVSFGKKLTDNRYSGMNHYIIAGFQGGIGQNKIAAQHLWFSSQWDLPGNFIDFDKDANENLITGFSKVYPDLNAGLLWYVTLKKRSSIYLGGGVYHLFQPEISLLEQGEFLLGRRYSIHGGANLELTGPIDFSPSFAWMSQYQQMSGILGGYLGYHGKYQEDMNFRLGLHTHFSNALDNILRPEAISVSAVFERSPITMIFAYDFTISELSSINSGRGAFETVLSYTRKSFRKEKIRVPKF
jgi:type IX secretion system PorP/SprF family membrane protein